MGRDAVRPQYRARRQEHHGDAVGHQQRFGGVESVTGQRVKQHDPKELQGDQSGDRNGKQNADAHRQRVPRALAAHVTFGRLRQQNRRNEPDREEQHLSAQRGDRINAGLIGIEKMLDQNDVGRTDQRAGQRDRRRAHTADGDAPPVVPNAAIRNPAVAREEGHRNRDHAGGGTAEKPQDAPEERESDRRENQDARKFKNSVGNARAGEPDEVLRSLSDGAQHAAEQQRSADQRYERRGPNRRAQKV